MRKTLVFFTLIFSYFSHGEVTSGIPANELFKQPDIFGMSLSPKGAYILEIGRNEYKRTLNLIHTKTFKKYRISTEPINTSAIVKNYTWLNDSTLYVDEGKAAYVVKIDSSVSPLKVEWNKIPIDGYILSQRIDERGEIIFAKNDDEYYRLYKLTVEQLLSGGVIFFQKYRIGLSDAISFYLDDKTGILIGHTYDEDKVQIWYLPPDEYLWSRLYKHDIKNKFKPITFIDKNSLAVLTDKESNYTYLAEFSIKEQKFTNVLYQHATHDLIGATLTSDGSVHSVSYIEHGVRNTEYFSSDAKTIKRKLSEKILSSQIAVIDSNDAGDLNLVFAQSSSEPGELYLYNNESDQLVSVGLVRKNLKKYRLAKAEVFTVKIKEGLTIEGIVTKPSVESNGVLLVNPHGGPIGIRDYANFNLEHQFYASRGYTILNVNFRGSAGFGKTFQDQGRGQFGQLIEQDIMAVYQYFIKENSFDYTCTMGASYGGYSAMMLAIKYPQHFKCAISVFGVFDLPHLFNATNRRMVAKYQQALKRVMGDDIEMLRASSPIKLAHKLEVPVLIMAGEKDPIAPFEQSNRMKYTLRKLGKSVDFHAYKNTGHGHDFWFGDIHQHQEIHRFIQRNKVK